jgi:hypothetical protein
VDHDTQLPLDIAGRLASGNVRFVTPARRLARRFSGKEPSPQLLASALGRALVEDAEADYGPIEGVSVDLDTAWRLYLERQAGVPAGGLSEEKVVAFCAAGAIAQPFARRLAAMPKLRDELHDLLGTKVGPVALIAWRAWEQGKGTEVGALAILLETATPRLADDGYLKGRLVTRLEQLDSARGRALLDDRQLLERWGSLADKLRLRLDATTFEALVAQADRFLEDNQVAEALADNRLLPASFELAREKLAQALEAAAATGSRSDYLAAREALRRVEAHRLADAKPHGGIVERARMVVRLLAYRLSRPDMTALSHAPRYEEVIHLAEDYARQGGFADFARRWARGSGTDVLALAIEKVVALIDELRDGDDERFARALPAWLEAGRPADRVVPVDMALDRFAAQFLTGAEHRRLLVLLMDGMAWANGVELLLDLEQHRFGPIGWRPKGADSKALLPPMLAAFPTITDVSRSALFAGTLFSPADPTGTAKDPARFEAHKSLKKIVKTGPRLLLKKNAVTGSGHASKDALALVASDDRVVGMVLNAIDDHLKAGPGLHVPYKVETVKALENLLTAATEAGRAVLLVADHGHVHGDRMSYLGLPGGSGSSGARWRELGDGDAPRPEEVVLEGSAVWRTKAKYRMALLYRERDSYVAATHEGEHGGASLAEVVAPAVLIAHDDLARKYRLEASEDREIEVVAFPRPAWWDMEVPSALAVAAPAMVGTPRPRQRPVSEKQLVLPVATPQPAVAVAPSKWRRMLLEWPLHRDLPKTKRDRLGEILTQVEILAEHDGKMAVEAFANRIGIPAYRVAGPIVVLSEWLNLDGYQVVTHDKASGQVRLDLAMLEALFGGGL